MAGDNTKRGTLIDFHAAGTVTCRTGGFYGIGILSGTVAGRTLFKMIDPYLFPNALASFHKVNGDAGVDVTASTRCIGRSCRASAAAKPAESTENGVKDVTDIAESTAESTESAFSACAVIGIYAGMTELVIARLLFWIV